MADGVYRVVKRRKGSDDPWEQDDSWMSRSGRPYSSAGPAKGEATRRASKDYNADYEFRVERSALSWEALP